MLYIIFAIVISLYKKCLGIIKARNISKTSKELYVVIVFDPSARNVGDNYTNNWQ